MPFLHSHSLYFIFRVTLKFGLLFYRIDREFHLDNCNASQCKDMFHNFFPVAKEEEVDEMRRKFEDIKHPISPADLQGYLLRFKGSLVGALRNTQMLKDLKESWEEVNKKI